MKRSTQKCIGLLLAVCMVLSLAACSGGSGGSSAASEPGADNAPDSGAAVSDIDVFGLDPDNPVNFDCYINFTWYPISSWSGIIAEEITKLTGVSMDFTVAVDDQQLGVMIASGDLPDLVFTQGFTSSLSTSDLCYDWQGLIDEYGTGWEIDAQRVANSLAFTQEEGKFFTVLSHYASSDDYREMEKLGIGAPMTASLLYRHDLYEALGSPEITTPEDIRKLLLDAKEAYPDMRPLICDPQTWRYTYFEEAFGLGQGAAYQEQEDGNWVTKVKDPRYRAYMEFINTLYRDGLFYADNYGMDAATAQAEFTNGKAFAYTHGTQNSVNARRAELAENGIEGDIREMVCVGDLDGYYGIDTGWAATFITKNCSNPEAAIRYMQFIHSEDGSKLTQWGREGYEYTLDENGAPVFSDEWNQAIVDGKVDEIYNTALYFGGSKVYEAIGRTAGFDPEIVPNYAQLREHYTNKSWIAYAIPPEGSDERIVYDQLFDGISGVIPTGEAKLALSESDEEFEANFKEMLDNCASVGMDDLEAYMNEKIKEAMVLYGVA